MTIDRQALDKLREIVGGDEADLVELIDSFLEEAPGLVETLGIAFTARDLDALRRAAHSLKSNARDMGATNLAEICARLEAQCGAGQLPGSADIHAAQLAFASAAAELRSAYPTVAT